MNESTVTSSTFTLRLGTSVIPGTVSFIGSTANFTPLTNLQPGKLYTGTITTSVEDFVGNALESESSWSFTTSALADATPPAVLSVSPAQNATSVAVNNGLMVTFSETINPATLTSSTFTLKRGTTTVAGTVTGTGSTATFTPSAVLTSNTVYTASISTGVKDAAGNALASNYSWNFTTAVADGTAPTILSVLPAVNATSAAISTMPSVTFSEAMNASTITTASFTLKQGTTVVAGTITYSNNQTTFIIFS